MKIKNHRLFMDDQNPVEFRLSPESNRRNRKLDLFYLKRKYNLLDVVGHDDISPTRKQDPGPAFPMEAFRSKVMGRNQDESGIFETSATLNIRSGPGLIHG